MDKKTLEFARKMLKSNAEVYRGSEEEFRKAVVSEMKRLRGEGFSYEQIAEGWGMAGYAVQPGQLRGLINDIVFESMWELIRKADEIDRRCATCPLRSASI